ncbi:hypothetical protein BD779DRAFT_1678313 [Infundibulicybe gibba]|nr:hypothetical protein BD779DRAFT_1678313 [Infundibulicybe gibba]
MSGEFPTSWANCPQDILMEITSHLNLKDLVAFLSICPAFKTLMDSRSLWIYLLERMEMRRPLACPVGTIVQDLGIDKLQEIAQRTGRLEANWNSEAPLILGAVKSTNWNLQRAEILHIIPGTGLAIIRTLNKITCCNLDDLESPVDLHVGPVIHVAHYDELDCHLMALVTARRQEKGSINYLHVFRVKYGNETNTTIERIFHAPLRNCGNGLFINKDVVGLITLHASYINVHATNFITEATSLIRISVGYPIHVASHLCSYMQGRMLSIVIADGSEYDIFGCPADEIPFGNTHTSQLGGERILEGDVIRTGRIDDRESHTSDLEVVMLNQCPLGLYTIIQFEYRGRFAALFRFWPAGNQDALTTLRLKGIIPYRDDKLPLIASSASGSCVAFILDQTPRLGRFGAIMSLYLVTFTNPDKICVHLPEVPDYINLEDVHSIGVDEHCGIIYLLTESGNVFAIPYA